MHCRSLTPSSSHLLWMVPTSAVPTASRRHSRSTSALSAADPNSQSGDLHDQSPSKFTPEPLPLRVPCCRDSRAAEPACNIGVFLPCDCRDHSSSVMLSPVFCVLDVGSADFICPHCHGIFGILNLQRKKPWASRPWAPFLLLEGLVYSLLLFIFFYQASIERDVLLLIELLTAGPD